MAYEMKEGEIIIFLEPKVLVSKKTGNPFDAYTGKAKVNGIEMEVFCFKNEKEGKKPYLSGSLKVRDPQAPMTQAQASGVHPKPLSASVGRPPDSLDSIPF